MLTIVNRYRPVNLALWTIRFPVTAMISITHRVTGVLLFLLLPVLLWSLEQTLHSPESFIHWQDCFKNAAFRLFLWAALSTLFYHLIAGIRHLLMDFHLGESKQGGRCGAYIVIVVSTIAAVTLGVWLWS